MRSLTRCWAVFAACALAPLAAPVAVPQPVKLSTIIMAYLPESGAPSGALPWTTGDGLAVAWQSEMAVEAEPYRAREGFTLSRTGCASVVVEVEPPREAIVLLLGDEDGIQQVSVSWEQLSGPFDAAVRSLEADGIALESIRCARDTEPAVVGNLVYIARAPGKRASVLWESWNCRHDGCGFSLTVQRQGAAEHVECYGAD